MWAWPPTAHFVISVFLTVTCISLLLWHVNLWSCDTYFSDYMTGISLIRKSIFLHFYFSDEGAINRPVASVRRPGQCRRLATHRPVYDATWKCEMQPKCNLKVWNEMQLESVNLNATWKCEPICNKVWNATEMQLAAVASNAASNVTNTTNWYWC